VATASFWSNSAPRSVASSSLPEIGLQLSHGPGELGLHLGIGLRLEQLVIATVRRPGAASNGVEPLELRLQPRELRRQRAGMTWVVPERRVGRLLFQLGRLRALRVDVKRNPFACAMRSAMWASRSRVLVMQGWYGRHVTQVTSEP